MSSFPVLNFIFEGGIFSFFRHSTPGAYGFIFLSSSTFFVALWISFYLIILGSSDIVLYLWMISLWSLSLAEVFPSPKTALLKLPKEIITTVTLSRVLLKREFFKIYSTAIPLYLWTLEATFSCLLSWTLFHTQLDTSSFDILSKIPSQPKIKKS